MVDERFRLHRLYSTRLAAVVTAVLMAAWFMYQLIARDLLRWDIFVFLIIMAVSKVVAMLYYRFTN